MDAKLVDMIIERWEEDRVVAESDDVDKDQTKHVHNM